LSPITPGSSLIADARAERDRRTEDQKRTEFLHDLRDMGIVRVGVHRGLVRPTVDDVEGVAIGDLLKRS
jgi:hypothetical protein